jgi:phospholipid/cholesterol/gamma-HCH transport system substrate-binding protein
MRGFVRPLIKMIAFLLVTATATYVLAATINNAGFGKAKTYYGIWHDATGLVVGDDVRAAGVRVGTVSSIKLIPDPEAPAGTRAKFVAKVGFSVAETRPLTTWVRAALRFRNLVGQRYLAIEPGVAIPGVPEEPLPARGTIPMSQTQDALDLSALFAGFKPLFSALNPAEINSLSLNIIQTLQGEGGTVTNLLRQTASLTSAIADKDAVIGDLIDHLSSVLDTIGQRDTQLSELILQLQRFVSGLSDDRKTIGDSITGVNNLTSATADLIHKIRPDLNITLQELTVVAKNLNDKSDVVEGVIQRLPGKVAGLTRTATYGSWFNFYLCNVAGTITLPGGIKRDINLNPGLASRCK